MPEENCEKEGGFSTFKTEMAVRPDDIDMNQHVHNSRYLDYVLAARFDQMERCYGMSMGEFLEEGYSWFVRTAHIEHRRQLNLGDRIVVQTRVAEIGRREVKVAYEIFVVGADKVSASGYFDYILVDRESGKARTIPEHVREKYSV